jgi:site-specific recombinase XerD
VALTGECLDCGSSVLHARGRCTPCYWKAHREAAKRPCPGCRQQGILRDGGLCGMCTRRARPRKKPALRACRRCGRIAGHEGLGLCAACYQSDPARVVTWTAGALERLGDDAPAWFARLAADLSARCATAVAKEHLRKVEGLAHAKVRDPAAVVAALRVPGRSSGATARLVDEFFARAGLGSHLDESARRAASRRQRRLDNVPQTLRPAVSAFASSLLSSRQRALLVGGSGLADTTVEARIADVALLACQVAARGITGWAAVSAGDIETFITSNTGSRLASCRAFFAFARRRKLILVNPMHGISRRKARGFAGRVLSREHQRDLLQRWMSPDIDPRERVVGLLSLIHGASGTEMRNLQMRDINLAAATVRLGRRPHHVPLDPITVTALTAAITARARQATSNPHLLITKDSRSHETACSPYFMTHVLDGAGIRPSTLRQTRLAEFAHQLDPRLVAAAFGMTEEGALHYLIGAVNSEDHAFTHL